MVVSSLAPINARTRTAIPTIKVGANTTMAIPVASGIPVLKRLVNSEEGVDSLIEILQVEALVSLFILDFSETIRVTCFFDLEITEEAVVRPIRRFLFW